MISYVRKYLLCGFRKINTNLLYNQYVKKKKNTKKLNINIASIFITLTEINNETHYVPKKNKTKQTNKNKDKKKQDKTAPIGFALSVSICRGRGAATIRSRLWYNDQICKFCFLFCGIYKGVPDVNWCNSIIKTDDAYIS